ncbi:fumarylacetoacetase [Polaromonas naphthalenivorans]|uniref:fumarylacetoacetase n=1 Tax=Polaromonas naphthalenivorans (strain CJ2) TaxID=365044 RepID=A1VLA6_POLNA|nr:fumarylacetoacetase [Polaromonas naphthalenivorans]ABM36434.1 fumarylacetoacetate hydrolase [Polaromonas naphthalenivorans CJ2]
MSPAIDGTHDAALQSWVESANDPASDFPIQNLPFGRFRGEDDADWHVGVAIGDQVLDLHAARLIASRDMNRLMRLPPETRHILRQTISQGLRAGSAQQKTFQAALRAQSKVELGLPCQIGDYTDFYTSVHHATTIGKQLRPDNPLLPNYKWLPIGYHGRASSIIPSGQGFHRPKGQTKAPGQDAPTFGPCRRLDYELELGMLIARPNVLGEPIAMADAESHVFGVSLFNDWSARDIQAWEYQPLGPFLSKNFASTLSPWMVTLDALAPFRAPFTRPEGDPEPLEYLDSPANRAQGAINIELEVWLQTARMRQAGHAGERISQSNYRDAYWTMAQLVAHHTVNGCNLRAGDLFGSGTLSGPKPEQGGSLMELSAGGKQPLALSNGETRSWLEDGDSVILRGYCQQDGFRRIGFGECRGLVLAATV